MISCKKATELTERKNLGDLGFIESKKLRFHSNMCKACMKYQRQSDVIDQALEQIQNVQARDQLQLSDVKKKEIILSCR